SVAWLSRLLVASLVGCVKRSADAPERHGASALRLTHPTKVTVGQPMSEAFFLRWKLDQPFVYQNRSEDIYALVTIEPNPQVLAAHNSDAVLPAHLIVLVDVSAS